MTLFFSDTYIKGTPAVFAWLAIDGVGAKVIGRGWTRALAAADAMNTVRMAIDALGA